MAYGESNDHRTSRTDGQTDGQTNGQTDDLPWKYRALCIMAKRCVLEQKLLLTAYRKSYMRNRLLPK